MNMRILISTILLLTANSTLSADVPLALKQYCPNRHFTACESSTLKQGYEYSVGSRCIVWLRHERADATQDWIPTRSVYTTSYDISSVISRDGGDILFVAGVDAADQAIVEQWDFSVDNGQWIARGPTYTPPLVAPYPPHLPFSDTLTLSIKGGGAFVAPSRGEHVAPRRRVIYQGASYGTLQDIATDPEGRYLFAITYPNKTLLRGTLSVSSVSFQQIFDTTTLPHLSVASQLSFVDHSSLGRLMMMAQVKGTVVGEGTTTEAKISVLQDSQNDGTFESSTTLDLSAFVSDPQYSEGAHWAPFWTKKP